MKRNKLILAVLSIVLSIVMFAGCTASNFSKGKYTNIVGAVGDVIVAADGDVTNLYKDGKKLGDSAYEIEPIFFENVFTNLYQAKRTMSSGWELMGADGKFLQSAAPANKVVSLEPFGSVAQDKEKVGEIELKGFIAETAIAGDNMTFMGVDGALKTTYYKELSADIEAVTSFDYRGDPYDYDLANNNAPLLTAAKNDSKNQRVEYLLKADGTVVASAETANGESFEFYSVSEDVDFIAEVIDVTVNNEGTKTECSVYSRDGAKIGTYDYFGTAVGNGYVYFTDAVAPATDKYTYIDINGAKDITADYNAMTSPYDMYIHNGNIYLSVWTDVEDMDTMRVKNLNTGSFVTNELEECDIDDGNSLVVKEKGATTYKILSPEGTALLSDLTNPYIYSYDENEDDNTYTLIARDTAADSTVTVIHLANGTKKTRVLDSVKNETVYDYENSAIVISSNDGGYAYKLWVPAAGKEVELDNGTIIESRGILSFTVKGAPATEGPANPGLKFATLVHTLGTWSGSATSTNNLYIAAGFTAKDLESSCSFSNVTPTEEVLPFAKGGDYAGVEKIKNAIKANTVMYRTVTFTANGSDKKLFLYSDIKGKESVLKLDEGSSVSYEDNGYFVKENSNFDTKTIHEFYFENNELKIRDIAADLNSSSLEIIPSMNGKTYIAATVNGRNNLYDMAGNKLLSANYEIREVLNDYVIVSKSGYGDPVCGLVKLEKNGKHKLVKQLEYASLGFVAMNGMMFARKNKNDTFMEIWDAKGKVVESKVVGIDDGELAGDNALILGALKNIVAGETAKVSSSLIIILPNGTEKLLNTTMSEDDMQYSMLTLFHGYVKTLI